MEVLNTLGLERIAIIPFEEPGSEVVFGDTGVVLFGLDDFARQLNSFILLVLERVDIDHPAMDQHTHRIAIGCIWVRAVYVPFKDLWVLFTNVLGSDDDLYLLD